MSEAARCDCRCIRKNYGTLDSWATPEQMVKFRQGWCPRCLNKCTCKKCLSKPGPAEPGDFRPLLQPSQAVHLQACLAGEASRLRCLEAEEVCAMCGCHCHSWLGCRVMVLGVLVYG